MAKKIKPGKVLVNRHVMLSRLKTRWSLFVWLGAAFLAVAIYFHGGQFGGMSGTVLNRMEITAPLISGRLEQLFVDLGDEVNPGDLLVQMDTSLLEAEKALVVAQMQNLRAEIKSDEIQNLRLFDAAIIRLESELRDLRLKKIEDDATLAVVRPEFDRLKQLVDAKLLDEQELMPVRVQLQTLERVTQSYPDAIAQIEASLAIALEQKKTISQQSKESIQLIENESIQQIRLFDVQIESCNIRAREAGIVSRIYFYPGTTVPEGAPIVSSVVTAEPRVIGFLSEYNARDVEVGMKAFLTPVSGHGPVVEAQVEAITPEIYTLPERASPIMGQLSRGRRVMLSVQSDSGLLPGEGVEIHIRRPWTTRWLWALFGNKEAE